MDQQAQAIRPAPCQGEGPTLLQLSEPGSHRTPSPDQVLSKREMGHLSFHLRIRNHHIRDKNALIKEGEGGAAGKRSHSNAPLQACQKRAVFLDCLLAASQEPQSSLASPTSSALYPHS